MHCRVSWMLGFNIIDNLHFQFFIFHFPFRTVIPYAKQHITEEDIAAVTAALQADYLTTGPTVGKFEEAFGRHVHAPYAVAVSSGTAALHLCALALGVKPGDKVLLPSLTFMATANCVRYCGGEPVFVDIDPDTGLLDLNLVKEMLEQDRYKGIIAVDYAGYPVDMEALRELADAHGCWIIEDSCHAPGGSFTNTAGEASFSGSGQYADLAIFSFHPAKHFTTGEGGMITTSNKALYEKLLRLRNHGITRDPERLGQQPGGWYYEVQETGYNYRLTDVQSALGISQLKRADQGLERRRAIALAYDAAFEGSEVKTIMPAEGFFHAWHLFVIRTNRRKALYDFLRSKKVFTQVHYVPVHLHPIIGGERGQLPHTEAFYDECLSLPMYNTLTDEEQKFVIELVKDVFK